MPEIDLGCTGRHAAAVRWKTEIAAAVESRGQGRTGHGESRQHFAKRSQAVTVAIIRRHGENGFPRGERVAPNARAGDDDLLIECGFVGGLEGRIRPAREQRDRDAHALSHDA